MAEEERTDPTPPDDADPMDEVEFGDESEFVNPPTPAGLLAPVPVDVPAPAAPAGEIEPPRPGPARYFAAVIAILFVTAAGAAMTYFLFSDVIKAAWHAPE